MCSRVGDARYRECELLVESTYTFTSRQQGHSPTLQSGLPRMHIPPPNVFQPRVIAPRPERPFELVFHHIHKASGRDQALYLRLDLHGFPKDLTTLDR